MPVRKTRKNRTIRRKPTHKKRRITRRRYKGGNKTTSSSFQGIAVTNSAVITSPGKVMSVLEYKNEKNDPTGGDITNAYD